MIKKEKGKIENMDIFNVLTMIGGLCLFLFGMNLMGQALERRAGGKLRSLLDRMTGISDQFDRRGNCWENCAN